MGESQYQALAALFLCLTMLTSGCTSTKAQPLIPEEAVLNLQLIAIQASAVANNGRPLALDIIYVYEKEALKRLQGFNADGWFTAKKTGLLDWNGQISIQEMQISPGESRQITEFPAHQKKVLALVTFAAYPNPGVHRVIIVGGEKVIIQLEQSTCLGKA